MTTTKKIQAVLATGKLALPEGLVQPDDTYGWIRYAEHGYIASMSDQQAYDLIACEWAREMPHDLLTGDMDKEFDRLMGGGLSTAAINAIYEALCGEEPK